MSEPRAGAYTFDFGQNLVGWVRLKLRGKPSQKIMVRHGEMLNPNGTLYTSNLRGANATDIYYLRGDGLETLEPAFTFHGFRYAEITGLDEQPEPGVATAVVVHSAMERTGDFESSSALLNQLFRNVVWGQRGNYVEVPTDCPQRDERAGWTGDAQFFARTATYNFDVAAFLSRWLATLTRDAQLPSGAFANVAPMFGSPWAAAGWGGDAVIITTHTLYRVYDDTRIIERSFAAMDKYMAWLTSDKKDDGMRLRPLGDHLNLGGGAKNEVIAAAYRAQLAELMAEMAAAIGRTADSARYRALHDTTRAAFARDFILPDGSILDSSQTGYALAFTMGLVPEALREKCAQKYFETLRERDFHLATGFIGTPRLLPGLHLAGRDDVAYRVLLQETHPSWLFQVRNGATTIWERWDGWTPENGFQTIAMNSFNHYAFGSVAEYLYRHVAGLDLEAPGFRKVRIQPVIESGLTSAQASYQSISGRIASAWKLDGERLTLTVEVPPNTEATVLVPARDAQAVMEGGLPVAQAKGVTLLRSEGGTLAFRVGSGHYEFVSSRAPTTVAGHASTAVVAPSRSRSPAWRGLSASRAATEVRSANRQADEIQLLRAKDLVARPAELIDPDAYND